MSISCNLPHLTIMVAVLMLAPICPLRAETIDVSDNHGGRVASYEAQIAKATRETWEGARAPDTTFVILDNDNSNA